MFTDKNGKEITEGDTLLAEIEVKTGERLRRRGREKLYFSIFEKRKVVGIVRFGIFKDMMTFFFDTDETEKYNTHFYSGCGRTRAEKRSNESVKIKSSLSRVLSTGFCANCEILSRAQQGVQPTGGESAPLQALSTPEVDSIGGADTTPPTIG